MKKKREDRASKIMKGKRINKIIMIGVIAVIAIVIAFSVTSIKFSPSANAAVPIDGIRCESMEGSGFHIHAKLNIFLNGQNYTVPSQIGITNYCLYWMHTHDNSGIIHIESPVNRTFTLGHFFDIWKQKFSNNQVLNNTVDVNHPLSVFINGTKVSNGTNFRDINLHAHDVIAIVYGNSPPSIPTKADFSSVDPQK
ncbi:MAG TPA: hypothetical protein VFX18_01630 [Candidatus Nitrosocosmicus sp.]|nr:hypothetical protein [Candidatus Nitrosocosmicus sp.]